MTWVDFHMHTDASEDSDAPLRSMCDAAVAKGLCAVAVTDHLEMVDYEDYVGTLVKSWRDSGEAVPAYAGRLRIARGIELGEPLADLKRTEAILDAYDFDFVLGSQHKLNSLDRETNIDYYFYDYTGKDVGLVMDEYFDAVLELVNWGRFHALAHLTYPFRYIPEEKRPADFSRWQDRIDAILRQLARQGAGSGDQHLRPAAAGRYHPSAPVPGAPVPPAGRRVHHHRRGRPSAGGCGHRP